MMNPTELGSRANIRIAPVADDGSAMLRLALVEAGLSCNGVDQGGRYWFALLDGEVVGTIGLETTASHGLLRSLSVAPRHRGMGIAARLVAHVLEEATKVGLERVHLFSKDTGGFFERVGWEAAEVGKVAAILSDAPQVRHYGEVGWYADEKAFVRKIRS